MSTITRTTGRALIKRAFRMMGLEIERYDPVARAAQAEGEKLANPANRLSLTVERAPRRPAPFVLVATDHGPLIVNRNDYNRGRDYDHGRDYQYGMGYQLFNFSSYDYEEVALILAILSEIKDTHGTGVVAVDCGANIGVHTVEWARHLYGWGKVIAIEAQERLYYSLCGNIAINNCLNATALLAAAGAKSGKMRIPVPDYCKPASFGSLELRRRDSTEFIGQDIDYDAGTMREVISIDELGLDRLDLLKIDVEGMELDVLAGAAATVARHKPVMYIEFIKSDRGKIASLLAEHGYEHYSFVGNVLAVHKSDPLNKKILQMKGLSPGVREHSSTTDAS